MLTEKQGLKGLWNIVKGLLVLLCLVVIAAVTIKYIGGLAIKGVASLSVIVSKTDAVVIVALITGAVSILGVVISSIISKVLEYKQKTKRYLYEKREEPYSHFVDMVYKMMHSAKVGKEYSEVEMLADTVHFSQKLTLWGSSKVIKKWLKFKLSAQEKGLDPKNNLFEMEEIIFEIRKDMGLKRSGLEKGDLLSFFINDIKTYNKPDNKPDYKQYRYSM